MSEMICTFSVGKLKIELGSVGIKTLLSRSCRAGAVDHFHTNKTFHYKRSAAAKALNGEPWAHYTVNAKLPCAHFCTAPLNVTHDSAFVPPTHPCSSIISCSSMHLSSTLLFLSWSRISRCGFFTRMGSASSSSSRLCCASAPLDCGTAAVPPPGAAAATAVAVTTG